MPVGAAWRSGCILISTATAALAGATTMSPGAKALELVGFSPWRAPPAMVPLVEYAIVVLVCTGC